MVNKISPPLQMVSLLTIGEIRWNYLQTVHMDNAMMSVCILPVLNHFNVMEVHIKKTDETITKYLFCGDSNLVCPHFSVADMLLNI